MLLKAKDFIDLLNLTDDEFYTWIHEQQLPVYHINNQYLFHRNEVIEWLLSRNEPVTSGILSLASTPVNIAELLQRGLIIRDLAGESFAELAEAALGKILTPALYASYIHTLTLFEERSPVITDQGIAYVHPGTPLLTDLAHEQLIIVLRNPVLSSKSYFHSFFLITSANYQRHLDILCAIAVLCEQPDFITLLANKADSDSIRAYIDDYEMRRQ